MKLPLSEPFSCHGGSAASVYSEVDLTKPPGRDFGPVASFEVYSVFACMPDI